MGFQQILEFCKAKAIHDSLIPSEESVWRSLCRTYSQKFFTPLNQVEKLDPQYVISHVLEERLDGVDPMEKVEDLLDQIYTLQDPNYKRQKEENMDAFAKVAEERERKRMKSLQEKMVPASAPKKGNVDFSGLKNEK